MSKKEKAPEPTVDNVQVVAPAPVAPPAPAAPPAQETLSDQDKQVLQMGQLTVTIAKKEAERALAENKAAELEYKYLILQLYMKYGMTALDALDDKGNIHRNYQQRQG